MFCMIYKQTSSDFIKVFALDFSARQWYKSDELSLARRKLFVYEH